MLLQFDQITYHNGNPKTIPRLNEGLGLTYCQDWGITDLIDISSRVVIFTILFFQSLESFSPMVVGRFFGFRVLRRLFQFLISDAENLLGRVRPVPQVRLEFGPTFVQSHRMPEGLYNLV